MWKPQETVWVWLLCNISAGCGVGVETACGRVCSGRLLVKFPAQRDPRPEYGIQSSRGRCRLRNSSDVNLSFAAQGIRNWENVRIILKGCTRKGGPNKQCDSEALLWHIDDKFWVCSECSRMLTSARSGSGGGNCRQWAVTRPALRATSRRENQSIPVILLISRRKIK